MKYFKIFLYVYEFSVKHFCLNCQKYLKGNKLKQIFLRKNPRPNTGLLKINLMKIIYKYAVKRNILRNIKSL